MTMVMRKPMRGLLVEMTVFGLLASVPEVESLYMYLCVYGYRLAWKGLLTLTHRKRQTLRQTTMRIAQGIVQLRDLTLIVLTLDVLLDGLDGPLDGLQPGVHGVQLFGRGHLPRQVLMTLFGAGGLGIQEAVEVVDAVAHFHETAVQVGQLGVVRLEGCCGRIVCFVVCDWDWWRVVRRVGTGFFARGGGGGG